MIKPEDEVEVLNNLHHGHGKVVIKRNISKKDKVEFVDMFAKVELDVDAKIGYHTHTDDSEIYYITSGLGVFIDHNQVEKNVKKGDLCYVAKGNSHGIYNTGKDVLEFVAIVLS